MAEEEGGKERRPSSVRLPVLTSLHGHASAHCPLPGPLPARRPASTPRKVPPSTKCMHATHITVTRGDLDRGEGRPLTCPFQNPKIHTSAVYRWRHAYEGGRVVGWQARRRAQGPHQSLQVPPAMRECLFPLQETSHP